MPYAYYDANGFLAYGPTIGGWSRLRALLTGDEGREFVATGVSENPQALAVEVEAIVPPDPPLEDSIAVLVRAANKADGVLVLSSGVGVEDGAR